MRSGFFSEISNLSALVPAIKNKFEERIGSSRFALSSAAMPDAPGQGPPAPGYFSEGRAPISIEAGN